MATLTRTQIVSAGLQKAGQPQLTTHANTWLNAALRRAYGSWNWPFLHKRLGGIALATGTTSFDFGAGSNGETLDVKRVLDPVRLYTSGYTAKGRARIRNVNDTDLDIDETLNDPSKGRGIPTTFKVRLSTSIQGRWTLYPNPIPDKDYLVALEYLFLPANLSGDSSVPIYPEDETLIQMVYVEALRFMDDERGLLLTKIAAEDSKLQAMLVADRLAHGSAEGINEDQLLDDNIFR